MISLKNRWKYSDFFRLFNFRDEHSVGRSILLTNTLITTIANIFVSGVFYTGFLTVSGIDIVRVGIITFIPYIAWGFSLLSPVLLSKFKRRRGLLLFNHIFYYACVVLATTVMPAFVADYNQRTIWFAVFLFAGNVLNALVGSGTTAWHVHFLPDGDDRNIFFSYSNLIGTVVGTVVAIASSVYADSLTGSPLQGQIITILRMVSLVLFILCGLLLYLVPREYPYPISTDKKVSVLDIITVPIHSKKFLLTALIVMLWNAVSSLNGSTWSYYVLNTVGVGYTYMYIGSVVSALGSVFLLKYWRRAINYYSWFTILLFTVFVTGLMEFPIGFSTSSTKWVYIVVSIIQGLNAVGTSLVFANLFYINLPHGNMDIFITFWNLTANISALVGSVAGTWFISVTEPHGPWMILGLPFYGSQFLTWIKFLFLMGLCVYIKLIIPHIQPDKA